MLWFSKCQTEVLTAVFLKLQVILVVYAMPHGKQSAVFEVPMSSWATSPRTVTLLSTQD